MDSTQLYETFLEFRQKLNEEIDSPYPDDLQYGVIRITLLWYYDDMEIGVSIVPKFLNLAHPIITYHIKREKFYYDRIDHRPEEKITRDEFKEFLELYNISKLMNA